MPMTTADKITAARKSMERAAKRGHDLAECRHRTDLLHYADTGLMHGPNRKDR